MALVTQERAKELLEYTAENKWDSMRITGG
jgi:hypothetical protein